MQEQTTFPALLAIETIPAPIAQNAASESEAPSKKAWPRIVLIAVALLLALWVFKHGG